MFAIITLRFIGKSITLCGMFKSVIIDSKEIILNNVLLSYTLWTNMATIINKSLEPSDFSLWGNIYHTNINDTIDFV